jgi:hypothetical protein
MVYFLIWTGRHVGRAKCLRTTGRRKPETRRGNGFVILLLGTLLASGCSVIAYTPVVATASLGLNKTDLSHEPEYEGVVGRSFRLQPLDDRSWQLKKFDGGRYYIEQSFNPRDRIICDLEEGTVVINEIFSDSVNGGVFYAADASCDGTVFEAPLNRWSDVVRRSISFTGVN